MKKLLPLSSALVLLSAIVVAADVPPVVAPAVRAAGLANAKKLLAAKDAAAPAALPDPFHSEAFNEFASTVGTATVGSAVGGTSGAGSASRPGAPRNARDLLAAIGDALKPSGYIVMSGQPSLSFGQKRVKPGGTLTITFEGAEYTVEVTAIDRANFTLRLNNEEYTRPIKK